MLKKITMALGLSALLMTAVSVAKSDDLQLFTNRGAFGGDDTTDWGQLGKCMTPVLNPFTATSNVRGLTITGAFAGPGVGQIRVQTLCGWGGNFASGDILVWTNSPGQGPLMLSFCTPIVGAGAQIQADFFGDFTAKIEAFSSGTSLGSFTENGISSPDGDNSAIFIGLKDLDGPNVTSIVLSLTAAAGDPMDFAINKLALDSGAAVSEPKGNSTASGIALN